MDPRVGTTETFSVVTKCALSLQKVFSKSFHGTWFHKGQQNRRTHVLKSQTMRNFSKIFNSAHKDLNKIKTRRAFGPWRVRLSTSSFCSLDLVSRRLGPWISTPIVSWI